MEEGMSNPGVILLAKTKTAWGEFLIEDNLGEAVHLHLDEIRADLTIDDFRQMAEQCTEILDNFISLQEFSCKELNPVFLSQIAHMLPDLEEVQKRQMELHRFRIQTKNKYGIPVIQKVKDSRILKALQGDHREDDGFSQQENHIFQSNAERTAENLRIIEAEGYDPDKGMIVIFNGQEFIRDGQHRAAALYFLGKNDPVETLDLVFRDRRYSLPRHPAIHFFLCWNLKKVKKALLVLPAQAWKKRRKVQRICFRMLHSVR